MQEIHKKVRPDAITLVRRDYYANGGWETFLSWEDLEQDILIGLVRLRKCAQNAYRKELVETRPNLATRPDYTAPDPLTEAERREADASFAVAFNAMCAANPTMTNVVDASVDSIVKDESLLNPTITDRSNGSMGVSIVRELHVYGSVVSVGSYDVMKFQHQVR